MSARSRSTGPRLSQISTAWTVLAQAHHGPSDDAAAARRLLVERYGGAVRGYLRAALDDPDAADDLAQQFALGLIQGDFRRADRARGKFRNYVKTSLFHLVAKHRQRERRRPRPLSAAAEHLAAVADRPAAEDSDRFDRAWRQELLARAWGALAEAHPVGYAALRLRADERAGTDLAVALGQKTGKEFTPAAARQQLHRARERFARYLLDAVAHSLDDPSAANLEDELRELELLDYCREAVERYRPA